MAFSLRQNEVPINSTILWLQSSNPPLGYTHDGCLDSQYIKATSAVCVEPGTTGGSNAHTHASTGAHVHCVDGGHTHSVGSSSQPGANGAAGPASSGSPANHTHSKTSASAGAASDSDSFGAHTQASTNSEPINKEFKYIKKTQIISLRNKDIPPSAMIYWTKSACLPTTYSSCITSLDTFVKGVSASCVAPGGAGGATTHDHGLEGCHTHTQTLGCHGHTYGGCWSTIGNRNSVIAGAFRTPSHSHTGNPTDINEPDSGVNSTAACHDHGSKCNNPAHVTFILAKKTQHSLRQVGVPIGASVTWSCPLACIPSCYAIQDGTLGTTCTIDKMLKIIPTSCATPGASAGGNGHQHCTNSCHGHTFNTPHGHCINAGNTNTAGANTANNAGSAIFTSTHSHAFAAGTAAGGTRVGNCTVGHQHACSDLKPAFTEVAFIERVST